MFFVADHLTSCFRQHKESPVVQVVVQLLLRLQGLGWELLLCLSKGTLWIL